MKSLTQSVVDMSKVMIPTRATWYWNAVSTQEILLGWQETSLGFFIRCYTKTQMKVLVNPVHYDRPLEFLATIKIRGIQIL